MNIPIDEKNKLKLAVRELSILNDIATAISSTQSVEKVIEKIINKCIKHMHVEEGAISLLSKEQNETEFKTMIRKQDVSSERVPIKLDDRLTGWMLRKQKPLMSNDIVKDDRFKFFGDETNFRSILCVPLKVKGSLMGYLAVFNKKDGVEFTEDDKRLLSIIGSQSAQIIENARLYEEEKALLTLQEEMRLAKEIQLKLLPQEIPPVDGYQISAINIPAKDVGGDYYDFISLGENRLGFCVGDITGKGMPAALLMSNLQASLRGQTLVFEDCCKCMESVNKLLYNSTKVTKFATLFYGVLYTDQQKIVFCNGGHDQPILLKKNEEPRLLETTGMLLGVVAEAQYDRSEIHLESGDLLVLYSDGITEAMNDADEEFGLSRLTDLLQEHRHQSPSEIQNLILEAVVRHSHQKPQSDDITLMIIKKS